MPAFFTGTLAGDDGEPGSSSAPSKWTPFCLSRAIRRSLLRCSRASSFSSLLIISNSFLAILNEDIPLLITSVLLSNAGRFDISEPSTVSLAPNSGQ